MSQSASTFAALLAFLISAVFFAACAAPSTQWRDLEPLPEPPTERMEAAVQERLAEQRRKVEEALHRTDGDTLAREYGALGRLYHAYDLLPAAAVAYRNAQHLDLQSGDWPYLLAVLADLEGRAEEALAGFEGVLEREPEDLATLLRQAQLHLQRGEAEEAEPLLRRALEVTPESAAARYHLGQARLAAGDVETAAQLFEEALERQPRADRMHYALAQAYRRLGEREKAEAALTRNGPTEVAFPDPRLAAVAAVAVSTGSYLKQGGLALVDGRIDAAVAAYRKAVELSPESAPAHQSLGAALYRQGDTEGAARHLEEALRLRPDNAIVHFNLGKVHQALGDNQAAEEHLRQAVRLDPQMDDARLGLADLLTATQRPQEALEVYASLPEVASQQAAARTGRAQALLALGRSAEALADLESVVAATPAGTSEAGVAHLNLGLAYLQLGQGAAARKALEEAVAADPGLAEAHFYLAGQAGQGGRFAEAAALYRKVVDLEPDNPAARLGEATALILGGSYRQARKRLEESLSGNGAAPGPLTNILARLLATCPDSAVRDGQKAVALARANFEAQGSVEHAQTLAMALAEAGRFPEAIQFQEALVAQARQAGNAPLLKRLEEDLAAYRAGRPSRAPWR